MTSPWDHMENLPKWKAVASNPCDTASPCGQSNYVSVSEIFYHTLASLPVHAGLYKLLKDKKPYPAEKKWSKI